LDGEVVRANDILAGERDHGGGDTVCLAARQASSGIKSAMPDEDQLSLRHRKQFVSIIGRKHAVAAQVADGIPVSAKNLSQFSWLSHYKL